MAIGKMKDEGTALHMQKKNPTRILRIVLI